VDYPKLLGNTALLKSMSPAQLKKLAGIAKEEELLGKSELFREGDTGDAMYIIIMGTVRVLKKNDSGDSEEVAVLGTGGYFGEMAIVTDDHRRSATIVAQEPTQLLALSRESLEALCNNDPDLGVAFYRAMARGLARRLNATTQDAASYRAMFRTRAH
jgi:CRP/FNR family transcriptional regulator, cyclic AMP receptor protein